MLWTVRHAWSCSLSAAIASAPLHVSSSSDTLQLNGQQGEASLSHRSHNQSLWNHGSEIFYPHLPVLGVSVHCIHSAPNPLVLSYAVPCNLLIPGRLPAQDS